MKSLVFLFSLLVITCANAQLYKCNQGNGKVLYSDKPCLVNHEFDGTIINTYGVETKLASSSTPVALPSDIVDQMFLKIEHACQAKDGEGLLDLFSKEIREAMLVQKLQSQSLFNHLSYMCKTMVNIRADMQKNDDTTLYATKKPKKDILLCFYTLKNGINSCVGNIKVTAEDKQLKLIDI